MSESPEGVLIGEAFPSDDLAGHWVVELSMAMNDLTTLDSQIHHALDADRPESTYYLRLLCGTLRELWKLFDVADEPAVKQLVDSMVTEARESFAEVRELFVRPPATEEDPKPRSWAEEYLKDVRDRTFHYPEVDSDEMRDALTAAADEPARLIDEEPGGECRRFAYADVVALNAAFGSIDQPHLRTRFEEILETAKRIMRLLVPVTWNALGTYLRGRGIDPHRLRAPAPE